MAQRYLFLGSMDWRDTILNHIMYFSPSLLREEETPRPVVGINRTDQSLKNPLLGTEVAFCLNSSLIPHHIRARSYVKPKNLPSKDYYRLFRQVVLPSEIYPLGVLIRAAEAILQVIISTWKLNHMSKLISAAIRYALTNPKIRSQLELHIAYQRIINQVSYSREADVGPKRLGNMTLMFVQSLVVAVIDDTSCLMTYNHFLAAADTAKSRCHLFIASVIQGALWEQGSFLDHILDLTHIIDSIILPHDDYFQIIKSISPYSQGLVMDQHNVTVSTNFKSIFPIQELCPPLDNLLKKLLSIDPVLLLVITSVQKSWYFPEINMCDGSREQLMKMRFDSESPKALLSYGQTLLAMFRAEFIKGYISKHGKWPPVHLLPTCNRSIRNARELGRWSPSLDRNWQWFSEVLILKLTDLDMDPDFNDIVSDKAIINSRVDWSFEYNAAAYRQKYGEKLERPSVKSGPSRLVNALIDGRLDDIPHLLGPFYKGSVEFEDRLTVLVPKEKELKVKGRFFSKQTLAIRVYQVIAEAALKNEIMPYLKTHSMTMSSTALTHLLNKLSYQVVKGESFVINLDYSSWCNAFRPELQMPICRQLDLMFDSGYFFRTGCTLPCFTTFIIQDRFNPPYSIKGDPHEDGITCAIGTKTMGEGMRQKLWTILTSCWEIIALREANVTFNILGQGDNQTIIVHKSPSQSNQALADTALSCLHKHARLAGHNLKTEECWVSDCLYEYGKRMFFRGVPVPGSLKQLSRVTDSTGELFPNLYSKLACLTSSCLSASMADTSPWVSLTTGVCLYLIELYVELPGTIMQNEALLITLCLVGPSIGGLPTPATLPSVFFRGMSDPLPLQLALLKTLTTVTKFPYEFINRVVKLKLAPYPDWLTLVTDPTSLNIAQVYRPERQIRRWIEEAITSGSHSSRIATFFQNSLTELAQLLARDLSTMMPLRPRDMSALFSLSNVAYGLSIIDLFQKSSTVVAASQAIHIEDVILESQRYKTSIINNLLDQSEGHDMSVYLKGCTHLAAKQLRKFTWGRELVGVTMPFVAEQFCPHDSVNVDEGHYTNAIIYCPQETLRTAHLITRGSQPLYLGSNTSIKVQKGDITGLNKSRAANLVRDTLILHQWYKIRNITDPNLSILLSRFLSEKGYTSEVRPHIHGGTLTHRLPSRQDTRQGLTGYINLISTWLKFSSDYLQSYSKSSDDYTIHFQHVFTYGCLYADSIIRAGGIINKPYLLSAHCSTCFEKIESEEFVLACQPMYTGAEWLISKPVTIPEKILDIEVEFDPCISASVCLGVLIGKSLLIDIRANQLDIMEQRTWGNLERFSISDLRRLPWSIVIRSIWRCLMESNLLQFERAGLIKLLHSGAGPTFAFLYRTLQDSSILMECTPVDRLLGHINFHNKRDLISKVILMPLINYGLIHSEIDRIDIKYRQISEANVDLYMAAAKSAGIAPGCVVEETNDFVVRGQHHGYYSLSDIGTQVQSQVFKMVIRKLNLTEVYIYPSLDPEVALDICHLPGLRIILVLAGDPTYYEQLLEMDLCGAVSTRVDVPKSLATRTHSGYAIGPTIGNNVIRLQELQHVSYAHPCIEELPYNAYVDQTLIDISDMCCLPLVVPCRSLFKPIYSNIKAFRVALLENYYFFLDLIRIKGFDVRPHLEEFDELVLVAQFIARLPTLSEVVYYIGVKAGQPILTRIQQGQDLKRITISNRLPNPAAIQLRANGDTLELMDDLPDSLRDILLADLFRRP
uniref:RNA-directed RNA polymerase n=1 Tax=Variegated squirrel bornavirus 1 TaxID=1885248 RepID=A0A1Y0BW84_9MONO|nr:RNA-dependent RNA polymerase [Variegated squirrel bornavirus 1]